MIPNGVANYVFLKISISPILHGSLIDRCLKSNILTYYLVLCLSNHLWAATNRGMAEPVPFEFNSDSTGEDNIAEVETSGGDDGIEEDVAMADIGKSISGEFDIDATMSGCLKIGKGNDTIE